MKRLGIAIAVLLWLMACTEDGERTSAPPAIGASQTEGRDVPAETRAAMLQRELTEQKQQLARARAAEEDAERERLEREAQHMVDVMLGGPAMEGASASKRSGNDPVSAVGLATRALAPSKTPRIAIARSRLTRVTVTTTARTSLDPVAVGKKIEMIYRSGLQRCHRARLRRDPSLVGIVELSFTVGGTGRVSSIRAQGFDRELEQCVAERARMWRFGPSRAPDGTPAPSPLIAELDFQLRAAVDQ